MGRTVKRLGFRLAVDMSPEFASNLDVRLEVLLSLIDIRLRSGTILKVGPKIWAHESISGQEPLFIGGWDTFDDRQLLAGTKSRAQMIYFASAEHSRKRLAAIRFFGAAASGHDAKFVPPVRCRLSRR